MTDTNGRARPAAPATLREAREQRKLLESQLAVLRLTREKQLLESFFGGWDGFGGSDLWDRVRPRTNDDAVGGYAPVPPARPSDRKHGADWPVWLTQVELDRYHRESYLRVTTNSYAGGLLRNLTNNVVSKGYSYEARLVAPKNKAPLRDADGEPVESAEDRLVAGAQAVIDRFLRAGRWNGAADPQALTIAGSREREIYRAVTGERGEAFVRFHPADGGLQVRMIDPSQVRDPPGARVEDGWSYGIRHKMDPYEDVETPEEYCVYWPDPSATGGKEGGKGGETKEIVPAAEILHLKGPDTPSNVKRGIATRFLFGAGRAMDRAEKLQENASVSAAVRATNAEIWQHQQQTQQQVDGMAAALASRLATDPDTGARRNVEKRYPGSVRRIPEGIESVDLPQGHAEESVALKMGDLQKASAASCAPAFWLGDTENANYSNLESASAPAVREGGTEQEYYKAAYAAVVWRAVVLAVEGGELPKETLAAVEVHVEAPAVLHRNELEKAQEDQIAVTTGWKDRQTCAEERGLDWETVMQRNEEYQERTGGAGQQLELPGDEEGGAAAGAKDFRGPVKESKDAEGHEHAADGKFGTGGAGGGKRPSREDRKAAKAAKAKNRELRRAVAAAAEDDPLSHVENDLRLQTYDPAMRDKLLPFARDADKAFRNPNIPPKAKALAYDKLAVECRRREARIERQLRSVDPGKLDKSSATFKMFELRNAVRAAALFAEARGDAVRGYRPPKGGAVRESKDASG